MGNDVLHSHRYHITIKGLDLNCLANLSMDCKNIYAHCKNSNKKSKKYCKLNILQCKIYDEIWVINFMQISFILFILHRQHG
jgi:hypothetical protein